MNEKKLGKGKAAIGWEILKAAIYLVGMATGVLFFFNWIGVIIGVVYFLSFKGFWRFNGFMLSLVLALANNGPTRGLVERTGIYPLNLVAYIVGGTLGLSFLLQIIVALLSLHPPFRQFKSRLVEKVSAALDRRKPLRTLVLALIIAAPLVLMASVNIDLGVAFDNDPKLLWIHAPSTVAPEAEFDLQVQCWDRFERISAVYKGTVEFSLESYSLTNLEPMDDVEAVLPGPYTFTGSDRPSDMAYRLDNGKDNGRRTFTARIDTPGVHYIKVADSETGNTYYSNPILVADSPGRIYWGDIHTHSIFSDGSGTPEHHFYYARHVALLDFHALTDHGEIIQLGRNRIWRMVEEANKANTPGEFVTFLGMEYTNHNTGHYTCIFDGDELPTDPVINAPYFSLSDKIPTPNELWQVLDEFTEAAGCRALALPHHTVTERFMQDWTYYNPKYVKLAEVTSTHGDNLYEADHPLNYRGSTAAPPKGTRGCSITAALQMGLNLSLYASSDSHDGHPGHDLAHAGAWVGHQRPWTIWWTRFDKPYPGGITAVYTDDFSRQGIFSALENRSLYASSDHGRPLLFFYVNGRSVGGDSTLLVESPDTPREIRVFLAQDGAPAAPINGGALAD
ncbi:MAG TPA: DUF3604 domain-containing protein, partial [Bacillota bacterium]|nr:DUF3604 domain-containing protein [Bacillota bacterium]